MFFCFVFVCCCFITHDNSKLTNKIKLISGLAPSPATVHSGPPTAFFFALSSHTKEKRETEGESQRYCVGEKKKHNLCSRSLRLGKVFLSITKAEEKTAAHFTPSVFKNMYVICSSVYFSCFLRSMPKQSRSKNTECTLSQLPR